MQLMVLSGSDQIRFPSMLNHKAYADRHGYRYRFDISPYAHRTNTYFHKLDAIREALQDTDWLFWIDDDAAFTQLDRRLEDQVPELSDPAVCAVFCASPVNLQGGWTTISSGNFFVRNSPEGRELIRLSRGTDLDAVMTWWRPDKLGMFTSGDQDVLIYQIKTNPLFADAVKILNYERFNTRPYHFQYLEQFFLVHFTYTPTASKAQQMASFYERFGLGPFVLGAQDAVPYASYIDPQRRMIGPLDGGPG